MSTFDPLATNEPARDELGRLLPHPYYWHPDYEQQRARDAASREFAAVLGEACRRMCAQHDEKAAYYESLAAMCDERAAARGYAEIFTAARAWMIAAVAWRRDAAEQRELAQIYRWYGVMLGELPSACTCRMPRYCPHVPGQAGYW